VSGELDARALFAALADAGVRHVVIGGWAVNAHGYVRTTKDIDLCPAPDRENLERLARLLVSLESRQLGLEDFAAAELPGDPTDPESLALGGNFRVETKLGIVDLMQWLDSTEGELEYADLVRTAVAAEPFGIPIRVCSLDHLIAMKRRADRERDRDDLRHLEAGCEPT